VRKFKYDSKNNLIQETAYFPNNNLAYRHVYLYDTKNNPIKMTIYFSLTNEHPEGIWTYQYEYDSVGNWIKRTQLLEGKEPQYIIERKITYQNKK
jgi:hypothetical protein